MNDATGGQRSAELRCRFCAAPLRHVVLDLGSAPLANSYLTAAQLNGPEVHYPLCTYICETCSLVQLPSVELASNIFSDYAYFSSFSSSWLRHAERYCEQQIQRFALGEHSLVVEVASNDGYLLQNFTRRQIPCLGIEPASNIARAAEERGIATLNRFLGEELANQLRDGQVDPTCDSHGRSGRFESSASPEMLRVRGADLVVANNVFAHVPDLNDFTAGLRRLLAPAGVLTIEVQHLLRLLEQVQFDTIYHEHYSYYSLLSAQRVLEAHGLVVFDFEELATHGGSMRLFCRRADAPEEAVEGPLATTERVAATLAIEREAGLDRASSYHDFAGRVEAVKHSLLEFLVAQARAGKRVVGYGAPAKGNTLLSFCGIRPDLLPYTVDLSPHKQDLFLPGSHVPIRAPEYIAEDRPDFILILPWNLREEITEQMQAVREWGGQFVVAVPELTIW